jgi:hypothetical protein
MDKSKQVRVFYSWQSDSPKKTNLNAIREALKIAATKISAGRSDITILPDEATRGTSGSPNIALKILEKIEAAEVFVADVTTITLPGSSRPCPNPNVSYELGYAVSHLGWDRVILLFNEAFGDFPKDLPFDLVQQRASPYKLTPSDSNSARRKLAEFLETAVSSVLENNPKRPAELRGMSREKLEHDHDVTNMKWLMTKIHLPTLDEHILELPHKFTDRALFFWEGFSGVVGSSLFNVYDLTLKNAVDRLYFSWQKALSHDEQYQNVPGGRVHVFSNPLDLPLPTERRKVWDQIKTERRKMRKALDEILERLRSGYIEIDLHKTNETAWKDYIDIESEFGESARGKGDQKKPRKR